MEFPLHKSVSFVLKPYLIYDIILQVECPIIIKYFIHIIIYIHILKTHLVKVVKSRYHIHIYLYILVWLKWLEIKITKYKQFESILKPHFDLKFNKTVDAYIHFIIIWKFLYIFDICL